MPNKKTNLKSKKIAEYTSVYNADVRDYVSKIDAVIKSLKQLEKTVKELKKSGISIK